MSTHDLSLTVNGTEVEASVDARTLLVHVLRDELGYTGPKVGCETGKCGACTVLVDGEAVKSCTQLGVQADGAAITTIAGLDTDTDELSPLQASFHEEHGVQCGYCTPGMLLAADRLLREIPDPSPAEIRRGLKGNICRCTGYQNIVRAVEAAAADRAARDSVGD